MSGTLGTRRREDAGVLASITPTLAGRLSGMIPRREGLPQELVRELDRALEVRDSLRAYAGSLQQRVPLEDMRAEMECVGEMLGDIGIAGITIMGERRFQNEERHILGLADLAVRLSQSDGEADRARAMDVYGEVRAKLRGLAVTVDLVHQVVSIGRPPGMNQERYELFLNGVENLFRDLGTGNRDRAYIGWQAVREYIRYNAEYNAEDERIRLQRDALIDFIIDRGNDSLAGVEYSGEQAGGDRRMLVDFRRQMEQIIMQLRRQDIETLAMWNTTLESELGTLRELEMDADRQRMLTELGRDVTAMITRLRDVMRRDSVTAEELSELSRRYQTLTGRMQPMTLAQSSDELVRRAEALADSRAARLSSGWWGQRALEAIEREDAMMAELCISMGVLQTVAAEHGLGGRDRYLREETVSEIAIAATEGRRAGQLQMVNWASTVDTAVLYANTYRIAGNSGQALGAMRTSIAEEARRRLDAGEADEARRLILMAVQFLQAAPARGGRWPGRDILLAALGTELEGRDASVFFSQGLNMVQLGSSSEELRGRLGSWGSGLRAQRALVQSGLTRVDALLLEDRFQEARSLLTSLVMYADTLERFGVRREVRGSVTIASLRDEWSGARMETALRGLIQGRDSVEVFGSAWRSAQASALELYAADLRELAERNPVGRAVITRAIAVGLRRARTDLTAAYRTLDMVGAYYGDGGARYTAMTSEGALPGYVQGRETMLRAIRLELEAETDRERGAAVQLFEDGRLQVDSTAELTSAARNLRTDYDGRTEDLPEILRTGTEESPRMQRLWSSLRAAASRGDVAEYRRLAEQLGRAYPEVAGPLMENECRSARDEALRTLRAMTGESSPRALFTLWRRGWRMDDTIISEEGFQLQRANREAGRLEGRLAALLEDMADPDLIGGTGWGEHFNAVMDEYVQFAADIERFRRSGEAFSTVRRDLRLLRSEEAAVQATTTVAPSPSWTLEHIEAARMHLQNTARMLSSLSTSFETISLEYGAAADETRQAMHFWRAIPADAAARRRQEGGHDLDFYVSARTNWFNHILWLDRPAEAVEVPAEDLADEARALMDASSRAAYLEQVMLCVPARGVERITGPVVTRAIRLAGDMLTMPQPPGEGRRPMTAEESVRFQEAMRQWEARRAERGAYVSDVGAAQERIQAMALSGVSMEQMEQQVSQLLGQQRMDQLSVDVTAFAAGVASSLIPGVGPLISTSIFMTLGFRGAVIQQRVEGRVAPTTWVMLGGLAVTAGLSSVAGVFQTAGRAALETHRWASMTREMTHFYQAQRMFGIARGITIANMGIGGAFMATMGYGAYQAFQAGHFDEGVVHAGMALFPLVHIGGAHLRARARAEAWRETMLDLETSGGGGRGGGGGQARALADDLAGRAFFQLTSTERVARAQALANHENLVAYAGELAGLDPVARLRILQRELPANVVPHVQALFESPAFMTYARTGVESPLSGTRITISVEEIAGAVGAEPVRPPIRGTADEIAAQITAADLVRELQGAGRGVFLNDLTLIAPGSRAGRVAAADAARRLRQLPEGTMEIVDPLISDAMAEARQLGTPEGLRNFIREISGESADVQARVLGRLSPSIRAEIFRSLGIEAQPGQSLAQVLEANPLGTNPVVRALRGRTIPTELTIAAEAIDGFVSPVDAARLDAAAGEIEGMMPAYMIDALTAPGRGGAAPAQFVETPFGTVQVIPARGGGGGPRRPTVRASADETTGTAGGRLDEMRQAPAPEPPPAQAPAQREERPAGPPGRMQPRRRRAHQRGYRLGLARGRRGDVANPRAETDRPAGALGNAFDEGYARGYTEGERARQRGERGGSAPPQLTGIDQSYISGNAPYQALMRRFGLEFGRRLGDPTAAPEVVEVMQALFDEMNRLPPNSRQSLLDTLQKMYAMEHVRAAMDHNSPMYQRLSDPEVFGRVDLEAIERRQAARIEDMGEISGERVRRLVDSGAAEQIPRVFEPYEIARIVEILEGRRSGRDARARVETPDGVESAGYVPLQESRRLLLGERGEETVLTAPERAAGLVALNDLGIVPGEMINLGATDRAPIATALQEAGLDAGSGRTPVLRALNEALEHALRAGGNRRTSLDSAVSAARSDPIVRDTILENLPAAEEGTLGHTLGDVLYRTLNGQSGEVNMVDALNTALRDPMVREAVIASLEGRGLGRAAANEAWDAYVGAFNGIRPEQRGVPEGQRTTGNPLEILREMGTRRTPGLSTRGREPAGEVAREIADFMEAIEMLDSEYLRDVAIFDRQVRGAGPLREAVEARSIYETRDLQISQQESRTAEGYMLSDDLINWADFGRRWFGIGVTPRTWRTSGRLGAAADFMAFGQFGRSLPTRDALAPLGFWGRAGRLWSQPRWGMAMLSLMTDAALAGVVIGLPTALAVYRFMYQDERVGREELQARYQRLATELGRRLNIEITTEDIEDAVRRDATRIPMSEGNLEWIGSSPELRDFIDNNLLLRIPGARDVRPGEAVGTIEDSVGWLRTQLERTDPVVDPARLNDLLTDLRQTWTALQPRLGQINGYLASMRSGRGSEAAEASLRSACTELGLDFEVARGLDRITFNDLYELRRGNWIENNFLLTSSDWTARAFAADTGIDIRTTEGRRAAEYLGNHPETFIFLFRGYMEGRIPRAYMMDAIESLRTAPRGQQEAARVGPREPPLSQDAITAIRGVLEAPIQPTGGRIAELNREHGAGSVDAVRGIIELEGRLRTRLASATPPLYLGDVTVARRVEGAQTEVTVPRAVRAGIVQDFLDQLDFQSIGSPQMREQFQDIVVRYSGDAEAWERLRTFTLPPGTAVYGDRLPTAEERTAYRAGGFRPGPHEMVLERGMWRVAEIIANSPTQAAAIATLQRAGYLLRPISTVRGVPIHLYNWDPRFRWDRRAASFVFDSVHSSDDLTIGLANWIEANHQGLNWVRRDEEGREVPERHEYDIVRYLMRNLSRDVAGLSPEALERRLDQLVGTRESPGVFMRPPRMWWNAEARPPPMSRTAEDRRSRPPEELLYGYQPTRGRGAGGSVPGARVVSEVALTPYMLTALGDLMTDAHAGGMRTYVGNSVGQLARLSLNPDARAATRGRISRQLRGMGIFVAGTFEEPIVAPVVRMNEEQMNTFVATLPGGAEGEIAGAARAMWGRLRPPAEGEESSRARRQALRNLELYIRARENEGRTAQEVVVTGDVMQLLRARVDAREGLEAEQRTRILEGLQRAIETDPDSWAEAQGFSRHENEIRLVGAQRAAAEARVDDIIEAMQNPRTAEEPEPAPETPPAQAEGVTVHGSIDTAIQRALRGSGLSASRHAPLITQLRSDIGAHSADAAWMRQRGLHVDGGAVRIDRPSSFNGWVSAMIQAEIAMRAGEE
ncbi:MAG: hypothetical protein ABIH29_04095 [Candidatus Micrarchaeota archaeon]